MTCKHYRCSEPVDPESENGLCTEHDAEHERWLVSEDPEADERERDHSPRF